MAKSMFGNYLSSIGFFNLNYDVSNLALIGIDSNNFPALVQTCQVSRGERIQAVPCFNDFIHLYCFGANPVTGNIAGFMLAKNNKLKLLIDNYESKYRAYNATEKPFNITTMGGETLKGLASNLIYAVNAERPALVNFSFDFYALRPSDTALSVGSAASSGGSP